MKLADLEYQKLVSSIKATVADRYVYSLDAEPITYYIREYRASTNEIILKRPYDANGILLNDN